MKLLQFALSVCCVIILPWSVNTDVQTFKNVKKRYDIDMQTCVENFDIHVDNIIRTQDSVSMGAKYINELDLSSREECLKLCCETVNCDVFVFEEKSPGSCYLFHCGTPDNFKCQFTKHFNYTSAVLTVTKHLTELETQIKFTKHEQELSRLRRPGSGESAEIPTSPPAPTLPKVAPQLIPSSHNGTQGRRCSRYQFECHNSGECIAIYNACDGIPQCADGSDEAVELDCPSGQGFVSTLAPVGTVHSPLVNSEAKSVSYQHAPERDHHPPSQYHSGQNWQEPSSAQQYLGTGNEDTNRYTVSRKALPMNSQGHQQLSEEQTIQHQKQHPGNFQHSQNGREYPRDWQQPPFHGQGSRQYEDQGSHIFNHKNNGLMAETDRYSARFSYLGDKEPSGPVESPRNEYKYSGNVPSNVYYESNNSPFQPPRGNNWQQNQQHSHGGQDFAGDSNSGKTAPDSYNSEQYPPPDYYFDDNQDNVRYHNHVPNYQHHQPQASPHLEGRVQIDEKLKENLAGASNPSETKPDELKRRKGMIDVHVLKAETSTVNISAAETSPSDKKEESSEKQEKKLLMALIEDDLPGNPSGAILSLALGLSILSVFIGLIACRLRVVRRHLRRGGKSPYAHDADYLVNGMYL